MTTPLKKLLALIAATALALTFAACGEERTSEELSDEPAAGESAEAEQGGTEELPPAEDVDVGEISTDLTVKPEIAQPSGDPPATLVQRDIVEGEGEEAAPGDVLTMQYVGVSFSTGQQFDASWDRGEPFQFPLGAGQVIQGWDQGLVGMKPGGRRLLVIPPDLGYGAGGQPPDILPNETLIFAVDLVEIEKGAGGLGG